MRGISDVDFAAGVILSYLHADGKVCRARRSIDGLYFYPKEVQERAIARGLTSRETIDRKRKVSMTEFYIVMLVTLLLIIGVWNGVSDFGTAYWQGLRFLEVMNIYDGIVIDKLWVGYSKFWVIPGLEDIPYVQTWAQMLKKRVKLALVWVVGAALVGGLTVLIF